MVITAPSVQSSPSEDAHGVLTRESVHHSLLQTALDSFFDSILVISAKGDIIQANGQAYGLFQHDIPPTLHPLQADQTSGFHPMSIPLQAHAMNPLQPLLDEIWRVCNVVMPNPATASDWDIVLDSEVALDNAVFRIRVRWLDKAIQDQGCFLATIEDLRQTVLNRVNGDRWKYKLTPRESEVWSLKHQGYSYRAIARALYVTENTVKKHLKNIQLKRKQQMQWQVG